MEAFYSPRCNLYLYLLVFCGRVFSDERGIDEGLVDERQEQDGEKERES